MTKIVNIWITLLISLYLCEINNGRTSETLKVTLSDGGILRGRYLVSNNGNGIKAFMGIPFAEQITKETRFKAPVTKKPWVGERLAIKDSDICIQRDSFRRDMEIVGSEDCLYLNVYTPQFPKSSGLLPVMVFFHGGGWQCGSGISMFYGPEYLMDHDIIYIGANFRLGPLGFLSTEQEDCPGNNGLKDQVEVLKWVQTNIHSFNGDKNKVTLFGESAGGASITYHMQSKLSKGLFHNAISQSGTNLNPWSQVAHKGVAKDRARKLGELLGCDTEENNWKILIDCLRTKSADTITEAYYDFFEWDTDPMIPFPPVIEPDVPGAFITEHPRDVKNPWASNMPWITGITADEGVMKTAAFFHSKELWDNLQQNWKEALPIALYYNHHEIDKQNEITEKISEFYFKKQNLIEATKQNFTNLFTDGWFLTGMLDYLRIRFDNNKIKTKMGPTYVYLFAHKGEASFTEIFKGATEEFYGVSHAEELQYLFPIGQQLFISAAPTKTDNKIREILTEMWVNFAYTNNPTPDDSNLPKWHQTKKFPLNYLRIGNKDVKSGSLIGMESGLMDERGDFWFKLGAHLSRKNNIKNEL